MFSKNNGGGREHTTLQSNRVFVRALHLTFTDMSKLTIYNVATYAVSFLGGVASILMFVATIAALQERKIWKPKSVPSMPLFGLFRASLAVAAWMMIGIVGTPIMAIRWVVTFGQYNVEAGAMWCIEEWMGRLCTIAFVGRVVVKGRENLPDENMIPAPIYIANHSSQIDPGACQFLRREFKVVAKSSLFYVPGVGILFYLSKQLFVNRKKGHGKKTISDLFEKGSARLQAGTSVLFFPQGTRRVAEKLPFRDGAFIMAQNNKSPLVPVSIEVPLDVWQGYYPLSLLWTKKVPTIVVTVHPTVTVTGKEDREVLKKKCMDQIYSVLPPVPVAEDQKRK